MGQFETSKIRNLGIVAHGGAGKTSLAEAILFDTGMIDRLGRVDDGTSTMDFEPEEIKRKISIEKSGSNSTVVWNPWILKSKNIPDFGDTEYETMVCVETTNAAEDAVTIPPAGNHRMSSTITVV